MQLYVLTSFLALLTTVTAATGDIARIDNALQHEKRQSVPLSTGGTTVVTRTTKTSTIQSSSEHATTSKSIESVTVTTITSTSTPSTSESESETSVTTIPPPSSSPSPSPSPTPSPSSSIPSSIIVITSVTNSKGSLIPITSTITQAPSSRTQEIITTFTTVTDGSTIVTARTSSTVVPVSSSGKPGATSAPTLDGNGGSSGTSGLSSSQKKTVIGVVVGIGGAIIFGALAVVAWRLWGKKKNTDNDDFYDPNLAKESSNGSIDHSPFRSTLDQYHNPGPVNTAHNF